MHDNPYESPREVSPPVPAKPVSSAVVWRNVCFVSCCCALVCCLTFVLLTNYEQQFSSYLSLSQRDTIDDVARCLAMVCLVSAGVSGAAWLLAAVRARHS